MTDDKNAIETLKDAIVDDDKKLGEEVPGAPFAVVGLSYLVILCLSLAAIGIFIWWMK